MTYLAAALVLLILAAIAYYLWQASIKPEPYEVMFEVRADGEPVQVSRADDGWVITASGGATPVTLRAGPSPDIFDTTYALAAADSRYLGATALPNARQFFEIDFADGRTVQAAERVLPLEGPANFRDLGGYATADGRRVAWGKVYRANSLSALTDHDVATLQALGVKLVCDLRTQAEVDLRPDRVPDGVTYRHMPVFPGDPIGRWKLVLARHRLDAAMTTMYRASIIDRGAPVLRDLLKLVADPANLPLVFHCTTGKDRTGVASALLLHICGVPRETIIIDYALTNRAAERFLAIIREVYRMNRRPPGFNVEQIYPLLSARPELIESAFAYIDATYGSVDAYLRVKVGLTDQDVAAIRRNLLV